MKSYLTSFLALVAGCVLPFAFAPYELWPLAFVSVAVLYWLVAAAEPGRARWLGWLFGMGYFGFGVYWIYYSLHLFGAAIAPLSAFLTLMFVLVMSLFPLLTCWIFARTHRQLTGPIRKMVAFASLWLASELMRGWLFGGFPWLSIGYSQIESVFSGYAPVTGVYGISWVVVLLSAALVTVLTVKDRFPRVIAAMTLALFAAVAAVLAPLEWTSPRDESLQIRLVQGNIKQEMKFSRERLESSLRTYVELTEDAPQGTQIVIWPETAIPTYFRRVDDALLPFVDSMSARGVDVLSGGFYQDEDGRSYNSFRQLGGDRALYSKQHLVPFGEYMPMRSLLEFVAQYIDIPMSDLTAAQGPLRPLSIQGEQLGISICFEDAFGEEMRELLPESTILINVSNDAWFGDSIAPYQHQEIARMRAREFARPLVRVTNTGISASIDHRGNVTSSIPHDTQGALDVAVTPRTGATPYVHYGNIPLILLALLGWGLGWGRSRTTA